jgi:hypothetical protein
MATTTTTKKAIEILRFDIDNIFSIPNFFPVTAFFGSRGSGKSIAIKDFCFHLHKQNIPRIVVFSMTENANNFFSSFVPESFIYSPVDAGTLTRVWEKQKELIMLKNAGRIPASTDLRLVIVLDDLAFDKKLLKIKAIREIFLNGRHFHIYLLISVQYIIDLDIALRSNLDIAVFFKDNTVTNKVKIHQHMCAFFPLYKTFVKVFDDCTQNFEVFIVNNKSQGINPEDNCTYYKADAELSFKFGSPDTWTFHKKKFISDQDRFIRNLEYKQKIAAEKKHKSSSDEKVIKL